MPRKTPNQKPKGAYCVCSGRKSEHRALSTQELCFSICLIFEEPSRTHDVINSIGTEGRALSARCSQYGDVDYDDDVDDVDDVMLWEWKTLIRTFSAMLQEEMEKNSVKRDFFIGVFSAAMLQDKMEQIVSGRGFLIGIFSWWMLQRWDGENLCKEQNKIQNRPKRRRFCRSQFTDFC